MPGATPGQPASNQSDITVPDLFRKLTVKQWWGIAAAAVACVLGIVALGAWAQSVRDDDKIAEKNRKIAEMDGQVSTLKSEITDKLRAKDIAIAKLESSVNELDKLQKDNLAKANSAADIVKEMDRGYRALRGKSEFLERFITYLNNPGDLSKKLFVDHVCALWKQSAEYNIHLSDSGLELNPSQIRSGLSPELRRFLTDRGVSSQLLDQAAGPELESVRVQPFGQVRSPDVTRTPSYAAATIQKQAQGIALKKIVRFFDGTIYTVPDEVAVAVHSNPECVPR